MPSDEETGIDSEERKSELGAGEPQVIVPSLGNKEIIVTIKNKIICTSAYILEIVGMSGYIAGMGSLQLRHAKVTSYAHFLEPIICLYVIFVSDIIASCFGIWTCLTKTGPKPMIFVCIWLLLTCLVQLCVNVSLVFEGKTFVSTREKECSESATSVACLAYHKINTYLYCSLVFILTKLILIALCRSNYPHVFNWLRGKQVYVDEKLVKMDSSTINDLNTFGGAYFAPCDIERLTARGALGGQVVKTESAIIVAEFANEEEINTVQKNRRSTLMSARGSRGSNEYENIVTLKALSPSTQIN